MKRYLLQTMYPDGTVEGSMQTAIQVLDLMRSQILSGCAFRVYDVERFGTVKDMTKAFEGGVLRFVNGDLEGVSENAV